MIEKDDQLVNTLKLAIQTQADVKKQLLKEIEDIKSEISKKSGKVSTLKFYNSSLHHIISDITNINSEVFRTEQQLIPEMLKKLNNLDSREQNLTARAEELKAERDPFILEQLDDPEKQFEAINFLINLLGDKISKLDQTETQNQERIEGLRAALHSAQSKSMRAVPKDSSRQFWIDEIAAEKKNNSQVSKRRLSSVLGIQRQSLGTPSSKFARRYSNVMPDMYSMTNFS